MVGKDLMKQAKYIPICEICFIHIDQEFEAGDLVVCGECSEAHFIRERMLSEDAQWGETLTVINTNPEVNLEIE